MPQPTAAAVARFATAAERATWNTLVAANPGGGEVWSGTDYFIAKQHGGYLPRYVIIERAGHATLAIGVLAKRVPLLGEWWHTPAGPPATNANELRDVVRALAEFARHNGAFLLKIEPRLGLEAEPTVRQLGGQPCARIIPNSSTVLVDVTGTPEELFARLGKKARNAINRSRRDAIVVSRVDASDEHCRELYQLLAETAEGRFVLRSAEYYRGFWQQFSSTGAGQLFLAHRDGVLVAGAYAIALGDKTTYKDGASLREKIAYGASHALQWDVLCWANERGARVHDLCGAPPAARTDDTTHPLHGVGQFKRSFSADVTDYVGAFDVPLRPFAYRIWSTVGDRLARRWSLAVRHDPYY